MAIKNPRLKKPHAKTDYTPEQIAELRRCINDPVHFISNYVYVLHPNKGRILFELYDFQKRMIETYMTSRWSISKIARQSGKTETTCAYLLWFALFKPDKTVLVAANKLKNAMEIINRITGMYEDLPDWLKPGVDETEWNKTTVAFENGSKIMSQATSPNTGRGFSISLLYLDELAFVPPHIQDAMWASILPVLSTGGSCIISSTPNGAADLYSHLFREAKAGVNGFTHIEINWWEVPGRGEQFKNDLIKKIGLRKWEQEYECQFLTSEQTLIDPKILQEAEERARDPEITLNGLFEQPFWKIPSKNCTYLVGVDPAQGVNNDWSVIEVFEFPSMEQVAEYRTDSQSPATLYSYLKTLLRFLEKNSKDVFYSVENNAVGQAIIALYEADVAPLEKAIFVSEEGKDTLGYNSNVKTKNKALVSFKEMFERGHLKINSKVLIKELHTLVRKESTFKAQIGKNDDCVFATLIVIRLLEDMAYYDAMAYNKLYSFQHVKADNWEVDPFNPQQRQDDDDGYMPFSIG